MPLMYLFPTPVYREFATIATYDSIQQEIQACLKHIKENDDLENVSYIYKDAGKRKQENPLGGYFIFPRHVHERAQFARGCAGSFAGGLDGRGA